MRNKLYALGVLTLGALLILGWDIHPKTSATVPGINELVSVDSSGTHANNSSYETSVSGDGDIVTFSSYASNLVSGDTNGTDDIFVRNRASSTTMRVSVSSGGAESNGTSSQPAISYDGRYIAFMSNATNLVSGLSGSNSHIYIHDMQTGNTVMADTDASGTYADSSSSRPGISADGRFVVFMSYADNLVSGVSPLSGIGQQIFEKDMVSGEVRLVSQDSSGGPGNHDSYSPSISCDGNVVAFNSDATNLVSGDTNNKTDVYLIHFGWSQNVIKNITLGGNDYSDYAPAVSCNGNDIAFASYATNLVSGVTSSSQVYKYDRLANTTSLVSDDSLGNISGMAYEGPSISDDGRYVVFENTGYLDNNYSISSYVGGGQFPYIKDTKTGNIQALAINLRNTPDGGAQYVNISPDGSYVAYQAGVEELSYDTTRALVAGDNNGYPDIIISKTGF